jgi:sigma-B regulation protein RsbU (phosphoserine phosphatase)
MHQHECELLRELAFEARASALTEMRRQVTQVLTEANCTEAEIQSIVIALNEACMNIIQHAYRGDSREPIILKIDLETEEVHFELLDNAAPIDLASVRSRSLDELRPGGLGVNFITQLMQDVHYSHRSEKAGNCLHMIWKRCPQSLEN